MPAAVAPSALRVPHSRIRELAEFAMSMDGVLKLYFGEPSLPTREYIKRAPQKAMADAFTFYTENAGLPSLRKALARYYHDLHGVAVDPASEIVVTASCVQAFARRPVRLEAKAKLEAIRRRDEEHAQNAACKYD